MVYMDFLEEGLLDAYTEVGYYGGFCPSVRLTYGSILAKIR